MGNVSNEVPPHLLHAPDVGEVVQDHQSCPPTAANDRRGDGSEVLTVRVLNKTSLAAPILTAGSQRLYDVLVWHGPSEGFAHQVSPRALKQALGGLVGERDTPLGVHSQDSVNATIQCRYHTLAALGGCCHEFLKALCHVVEGVGQLAHFPRRPRPHPLGQVAAGDAARCPGQPTQGSHDGGADGQAEAGGHGCRDHNRDEDGAGDI